MDSNCRSSRPYDNLKMVFLILSYNVFSSSVSLICLSNTKFQLRFAQSGHNCVITTTTVMCLSAIFIAVMRTFFIFSCLSDLSPCLQLCDHFCFYTQEQKLKQEEYNEGFNINLLDIVSLKAKNTSHESGHLNY